MSLKSKLLIIFLLSLSICQAQKYDGFVVTRTDSIFKGFMHITIGSYGREFKITKTKK